MQCTTCVCAHLCVYLCVSRRCFCACWCIGDSRRPSQWQDNSSSIALCSKMSRFPSVACQYSDWERWIHNVTRSRISAAVFHIFRSSSLCFSLLNSLSAWRRHCLSSCWYAGLFRWDCGSESITKVLLTGPQWTWSPCGESKEEIMGVVTNRTYLPLMCAPLKPHHLSSFHLPVSCPVMNRLASRRSQSSRLASCLIW